MNTKPNTPVDQRRTNSSNRDTVCFAPAKSRGIRHVRVRPSDNKQPPELRKCRRAKSPARPPPEVNRGSWIVDQACCSHANRQANASIPHRPAWNPAREIHCILLLTAELGSLRGALPWGRGARVSSRHHSKQSSNVCKQCCGQQPCSKPALSRVPTVEMGRKG